MSKHPEPEPSSRSPLESLGSFIRSQRQLARLSLRQLAALTKVSNPYLSQVERGLYKPSADVLKSIAEALHISVEALYTQAGLLGAKAGLTPKVGVEEAIRLDDRLTADQKDTLIRVYRGFVGD
jgi:transcriptional regulator with XRE-family HTH domain